MLGKDFFDDTKHSVSRCLTPSPSTAPRKTWFSLSASARSRYYLKNLYLTFKQNFTVVFALKTIAKLGEASVVAKVNTTIKAFTLAEVLIVLGIIGLIADMTIPTLQQGIQRKQIQTLYLKTFNELTQINERFKIDFGVNMCEYAFETPMPGEDFGAAGMSIEMKKYFRSTEDGPWPSDIKTLNNNAADQQLLDDGDAIWRDTIGRTYFFEYARKSTAKCPMITVDLNGKDKKPNKFGHDMFSFLPTIDGRFVPMGKPNDSSINWGGVASLEEKDTYCSFTSSNGFNGMGCSYWALINKHPHEEGKDYWKDFLQ